ncbi:MAG: GNAT family N-acetyltransferase [Caldilineaceae bacterium]|nr:GNAT family N-acetyltransferase [Caldilineaceae bacterium]HRJ41172.1 GNAT family N-acetyltransferase [Caldilineaceae bacterium]
MDFFPPDTAPPAEICTDRLRLRPLTVGHADLDYAAVMASRTQLNHWSQTTWPTPDFTLAENRADLERHQREHTEGVAFTYTVLDPTASRCLGCVYITPLPPAAAVLSPKDGYAANVSFWIRSDSLEDGLDGHLLATLCAWFAAEWPFDRVIFAISQQNPRQAELLRDAGLVRQAEIVLADGRRRWVYSNPAPAE